ncbi:hypothetical protein Tco_1372052 [Tanacetum coccineum]
MIYGRVQIHTTNKGLIHEKLRVDVKGRIHEVSVVEEVRDIKTTEFQEVSISGQKLSGEEKKSKKDDSDMEVDDEDERDGGESDSGDERDQSDDEREAGQEDEDDGHNVPVKDSGSRNMGEGEGSRFSGETKVSDTFEADSEMSKRKETVEEKREHEKYKGKEIGDIDNNDIINEETQKHRAEEYNEKEYKSSGGPSNG